MCLCYYVPNDFSSSTWLMPGHQHSNVITKRSIVPPGVFTRGSLSFINSNFHISGRIFFKDLLGNFKHFYIVMAFMQQSVDAPNDIRFQPIHYSRPSSYFHILITNEIYLGKFRRLTLCGNNAANKVIDLALYSK